MSSVFWPPDRPADRPAATVEAGAPTRHARRHGDVLLRHGTYTYVYGLGLISQTDGSGNQSYLLGNGLGSTEVLTDGSRNVTASHKYDVFGGVKCSSGAGSTQ